VSDGLSQRVFVRQPFRYAKALVPGIDSERFQQLVEAATQINNEPW
jgi:hypothetical protein